MKSSSYQRTNTSVNFYYCNANFVPVIRFVLPVEPTESGFGILVMNAVEDGDARVCRHYSSSNRLPILIYGISDFSI